MTRAVLPALVAVAWALCVSETASAGAPDPAALRAQGVSVQWPLQSDGRVTPGQRLVVRVRSARRPVRVALIRVSAVGRPMHVVGARRMRRGAFSVRVPGRVGARYQLSLAVGTNRYWTTIQTDRADGPPECPSAGQPGGQLRLDRTVARPGEGITVEVVNTGTTCLAGGWDFWYERLGDDGSWQRVEVEGGYVIPDIGIITYPGRITTHDAAVMRDLQPGRYRLVKPFQVPGGGITLAAEFDVVA